MEKRGGKKYMWNDLEQNWKKCFELAWKSFENNTVPIGAIIVDESNNIVSEGRNMIFDTSSNNPLAGTTMAHAEMIAMSSLKRDKHPNINKYTLYTTMEPCPMCFGSITLVGIRSLKYASRDTYGGATILAETMEYIKNKNIIIERGPKESELFQIVIQAAYEHLRSLDTREHVLESWCENSPVGVKLAGELANANYFQSAFNTNKPLCEVYDEILEMASPKTL